jgi:hypothetical protein
MTIQEEIKKVEDFEKHIEEERKRIIEALSSNKIPKEHIQAYQNTLMENEGRLFNYKKGKQEAQKLFKDEIKFLRILHGGCANFQLTEGRIERRLKELLKVLEEK